MSETILQLGAGRFLRAFVDRFVQHSNVANGRDERIVVVQSTPGRRAELLRNPQGFQVLVRGYRRGELVDRAERVQCISRSLIATDDWTEVASVAQSPDPKWIVSNATEAGYVLDDSSQDAQPPKTLPGKLTQLLWRRFQAEAPPLALLPCELIEANATKLFGLVREQARNWSCPDSFLDWLRECHWLNNLVDCIVTLPPEDHPAWAEDPAVVQAEPYALWAVERQPGAPQLWSHPAIQVVDELAPFYLRKVRILNGLHTALTARFLPRGFKTVRQVLEDEEASRWVRGLLWEEIVPTLVHQVELTSDFGFETYDRLSNPFVAHQLADIARHQADKVRVRLQPTSDEYQRLYGTPPHRLSEVMEWRP